MTDLANSPGTESSPPSAPPVSPAPPDFAAVSQPSYARALFLGPDGLRPGWGFVFYIVMFYPLYRLADQLVTRFGPSGELRFMMLEEFGALLAAVIPTLVLAKVERRPWGAYGLPLRQAFGKIFWTGALWGLAGITLLLVSLGGLHAFDFGHLMLHGPRIVKYAAFWAATFLLVGFFEEFLLRGYTQFTLTRAVGFWPGALLLSCAFGLIHIRNGGEEWNGLLAVAFIGLFFCLTLQRTGTLWFAVGFHAAWDWGETFVYSVPDSGTVFPGHLLRSSLHGPRWLTGGSVGPEGSVLCFVVIALLCVAFDRAYREVKYQVKDV